MIKMRYALAVLLAMGLIYVRFFPINYSQAHVKIKVADHANIEAINFSPDGLLLASSATKVVAGQDRHIGGGIQIWNPQTGALIRTLTKFGSDTNLESIGPVLFSPNSQILIGIGSGLTVWDIHTWKVKHSKKSDAWAAISHDGKILALPETDKVILWDMKTWTFLKSFPIHRDPTAVAFAPDSKSLAVAVNYLDEIVFLPGPGDKMQGGHDKFRIQLWNIEKGEIQRTFRYNSTVNAISFSPDGKTLAAINGAKVQLWDIEEGRIQKTFKCNSTVNAISFSPDGNTLAVANNAKVQLWDIGEGRIQKTFKYSSTVNAISFSPDGNTLAAGDSDGFIEINKI